MPHLEVCGADSLMQRMLTSSGLTEPGQGNDGGRLISREDSGVDEEEESVYGSPSLLARGFL